MWADLDGDGNPDASLMDGAGHLHVLRNQRAGVFREVALPPDVGSAKAITPVGKRHGGSLDLLVVRADGAIARLVNDGGVWSVTRLAQVPETEIALNRDVRLLTADLDDNGAVDLILAPVSPVRTSFNFPEAPGASDYKNGALIWLAGEDGAYTLMGHPSGSERVFAAAGLDNTGHLDLLGLDGDGHPVKAVNHGTKNYHWQVIRTRAVQATGDQRINSFGIGGEVEIRSGLLLQSQPITGTEEHFGLGTWTRIRFVNTRATIRNRPIFR